MYAQFFGFKEKPFNLTPDPRFLFFSEQHEEALAVMRYGYEERKGFMVLTGEVGTGKTTLVRAFLDELEPGTRTSLLFNPNVFLTDPEGGEFLKAVLEDLGLPVADRSKRELLSGLNEFLIEGLKEGHQTILVVDEAQNLSPKILEEIRLLTNLETPSEKLLQLLLVGQPELSEKLDHPAMRQLKQRVSARFHLGPLDMEDTKRYIQRRLEVAGVVDREVFTSGAAEVIYEASNGIPRVINNICDNALLTAYAVDRMVVDESILKEILSDLRLTKVPEPEEVVSSDFPAIEKIEKVTVTESRVPVRVDSEGHKPVPLNPQELFLCSQMDGFRTIETILRFTAMDKDTGLRVLQALVDRKIVTVQEAV